jgi:trans-aconitate methyltransferase
VTSQSWDPERYARNARFVSDLGTPVLELLAPRAGERILDIGCGDGVLTARIEEAGASVVGVDSSPAQVEAARRLGLDARVLSGERLDLDGEFDAVFSNAALHWMKRADDVIAGVWSALRPGGRFVGEMGGHRCVQTIVDALLEALRRRQIDGWKLYPWYFATAADYRARLEARGFDVLSCVVFPRPTPLPGDIVAWLETFAESFTSALRPDDRPAFLAEVREALRPRLCDAAGIWTVDYTRLRFAAKKPEG